MHTYLFNIILKEVLLISYKYNTLLFFSLFKAQSIKYIVVSNSKCIEFYDKAGPSRKSSLRSSV